MSPQELLVQMRQALAEERDAIRRLDVKGVTAASAAKEAILARVMAAPEHEHKKELASALLELKGELRQNLVLLAHARDYLRDAIALCASAKPARPRLQASL
ncbi:MAG: hypothetical protein KIT84_42005 [Labilithrix sp.]|nr:hypothetical protein [Labilithrix sp.]MCW5817649.1 hypothetical protein [Labilithrix sp.]